MTVHAQFVENPVTLESATRLRHQVVDVARRTGGDQTSVALAVTEAVSNVFRHAYPDAEGPVVVSVDGVVDGLVVVVADQGVGARSFAARAGDVDGFGLKVIQACCDATIEPTSDGTVVTMRFPGPKARC